MSDFGSDYVILTDEDGNNFEVEKLFSFEYKEEDYAVFLPTGGNDNEMILLRSVYEDGEEQFENIPEDIYDEVYDEFMNILYETE